MEKSESIKNLTKAVLAVMAEVEGIEKNLTVGSGNNTYQGVADQEVKKIIGQSMRKNGLIILCTDIAETTQLESWDETNQYGTKRKQTIFTKVTTTYLLSHESGEYVTLKGYGHGVDSQDKSAGKATTYALKYALLYTFLVPTGKIDDADSTHSDEIKTKPAKDNQKLPILTLTHSKWPEVIAWLKSGGTISELKGYWQISTEVELEIKKEL